MSSLARKITKLLAMFPAVTLMVLSNIFICFSVAGVVLMQLLSLGVERYLSLGVACLVAIGVHFYIAFNHKIREYINSRGVSK